MDFKRESEGRISGVGTEREGKIRFERPVQAAHKRRVETSFKPILPKGNGPWSPGKSERLRQTIFDMTE